MGFFEEAGRKNQVASFLLLLIYFMLILQIFLFKIYFKKPPNLQNKNHKQPRKVNWSLRK